MDKIIREKKNKVSENQYKDPFRGDWNDFTEGVRGDWNDFTGDFSISLQHKLLYRGLEMP